MHCLPLMHPLKQDLTVNAMAGLSPALGLCAVPAKADNWHSLAFTCTILHSEKECLLGAWEPARPVLEHLVP